MPTVKELLGWLPESVWHLTKGDYWLRFIDDRGDPVGQVKKVGKDGYADYPFSVFNPVLAERVYRYWSEEGGNVLDPFAGRTTRGLVARVMGRNYEGYEVAPATYELTKKALVDIEGCWQPDMFSGKKLGTWQMNNSDGCTLADTPDGDKDLVFTCPPYWKVEKYEECPDQLSRIGDYQVFLEKMRVSGDNCRRVLKPGGYCVFVVADFRFDGKFFPYHSDMLQAFKSSGLSVHDIIVNRLNSPFVSGAQQAMDRRRTLKIHEYILVWRKPTISGSNLYAAKAPATVDVDKHTAQPATMAL